MLPILPEQTIKVMVPVGVVTYPFDAKVLSVEKSSFRITIPRRKVFKFPIPVNREVQVVIPSAEGLIMFLCRIQECENQQLALTPVQETPPEKIQRRQFKRTPLLPLIIAVVDIVTEWDQRIAGRVKDLSLGGCAIVLTPGILDGTEVRLSIHLPGFELVVPGHVTHCQTLAADPHIEHQIGIRFGNLESDERAKLEHFLEANAPKEVRRKTDPLPSLDS